MTAIYCWLKLTSQIIKWLLNFLTFESTNTADFGTQEQEAFTSILGSGRAKLTANLETETTSFAVSILSSKPKTGYVVENFLGFLCKLNFFGSGT